MTSIVAPVQHRRRLSILLAGGQVRYQLLLLIRNRMSTFTILVIPLMLLVVLNLVGPDVTLQSLHGMRYADFLTPAMAVFGLLNSCYVNVVTSVVTARENGVLKRLHSTPLPLWAYVLGRMAAAAVSGALSVALVLTVGTVFLHAHLRNGQLGALVIVLMLAVACFTLLGLAVGEVVSDAQSALAVAYGTLLPVAFVSDVFFPATTSPGWLRHVAALMPVTPISHAVERIFEPGWSGAVLSHGQLCVLGFWALGAALVIGLAFRWQPDESLTQRLRVHR